MSTSIDINAWGYKRMNQFCGSQLLLPHLRCTAYHCTVLDTSYR